MLHEFNNESPEKEAIRKRHAALYAEGGKRAMAFVKDFVKGKKYKGKQYCFDGELLIAINKKVLFYGHRDVRGQLRDENYHNTEVDNELAASGRVVGYKFPLFGRWMRDNASSLLDEIRCTNHQSQEFLLKALQTAAGIHWGITTPDHHPFIDGNGRTARAVVNGFLMSGTQELKCFGIAIPPVPLLRSLMLEKSKTDPYILALRKVRETNSTNPLEKYIAEKWAATLDNLLTDINNSKVIKPGVFDRYLIDQFRWRRDTLSNFINLEDLGKGEFHPIPLYFERRYS